MKPIPISAGKKIANRQTVAKIREVEQFGAKMVRLDVPFFDGEDRAQPAGYTTRFAGGPSLYQVSPLDEELALSMARRQADPRPVRPTVFRIEQKSEGAPRGERPEEGDDDPINDGEAA